MKSNSLSTNLKYVGLLIIIKNIIMLLFIGLIFVSIISLFTKTKNNKIIEGWPGSWFESKDDKRRRQHREREAAAEAVRRALAFTCINPTADNMWACGPNYYFPENHFEAGAGAAYKDIKQRMDSSKKADTAKTSELNKAIRTY
jgi:hypothetical protein